MAKWCSDALRLRLSGQSGAAVDRCFEVARAVDAQLGLVRASSILVDGAYPETVAWDEFLLEQFTEALGDL